MPTVTLNSEAWIWPKESGSTLLCDGSLTDNIVDEFGINIKIRQVFKSGTNIYGDATETYSDTMSRAYLHRWMQTDDEVKEGIYKNGQITFVFKNTDKKLIKPDNLIFYASEWYRIMEVYPQIMAGITYLINAQVDKVIIN